jgi:hypothetical protein
MTGSAKQSIARQKRLDCFVALLPCANASRLSQTMTGGTNEPFLVMAGLVPAIHVFFWRRLQDVDARHKAGHDG